MKADTNKSTSYTTKQWNSSENPTKQEAIMDNDKEKSLLINILPVLSMIFTILPGVLRKVPGIEVARDGILIFILTTVLTFYIRMNIGIIRGKKNAKLILLLCYLTSICLLMLIPKPESYCFWMIGGMVLSMIVDSKVGLLVHFNMTFLLGISFEHRPETVIQILIIGALMSLLSGALKQKSTVIYATIILISTNITLSFAMNNFIFDTITNYNYLGSLFSILSVIVISFFIHMLYAKFAVDTHTEAKEESNSDEKHSSGEGMDEMQSDVMKATEVTLTQENASNSSMTEESEAKVEAVNEVQEKSTSTDTASTTTKDPIHTKEEMDKRDDQPSNQFGETQDSSDILTQQRNLGIRTSYEVLCDTNNELLRRLKQFSDKLYDHAMLIGDLSKRAARVVGANEDLALAGGLYHEIGKLHGNNYIEEGLIIAEDYAFPNELRAIIKEHNIKYDKPNSVEAAIVMLSDNVVSTIEYIEKTGDNRFTKGKIIDHVFQMRIEKGTFDQVQLSKNDYDALKDFYHKEFLSE